MANFGDFRGSLDKIIDLLKRIDRNTRCIQCNSTTTFTIPDAFTEGQINNGFLTTNGTQFGTLASVTAIETRQDLVDELNVNYAGIAIFVLNGDNSITVITLVPVTNPGLTITIPS